MNNSNLGHYADRDNVTEAMMNYMFDYCDDTKKQGECVGLMLELKEAETTQEILELIKDLGVNKKNGSWQTIDPTELIAKIMINTQKLKEQVKP